MRNSFRFHPAPAAQALPHDLDALLEQIWSGATPAARLETLGAEARQIAAEVLWMWTHTRGVPHVSRSAGWATATMPASL